MIVRFFQTSALILTAGTVILASCMCGTVSAAGNRLMVLTERGELVISKASPGGFDALSRAQVNSGRCWTVPVLANGAIYTRNARGRLVALGVGGKG